MRTLFLIALGLSAGHHALAEPPLLQKARELPQEISVYSFDVAFTDNDIQMRGFVDPSRGEGKRVTVYEPATAGWNNKLRETIEAFDSNPLEDFWCRDFLRYVSGDAREVRETDRDVVIAFSPQPSGAVDAEKRRFFAQMIAQLTIDKGNGQVRLFELQNRKPFKPIMIAKIESYQLTARCEASPDGRTFAATIETSLIGKVALRKIHESEVRTISNLKLVE